MVGQGLVGSFLEHLEDETSLGEFREVATAVGGRTILLGKVLPCSGTSGVAF